jgi:hypothetical protein
LLGHLSQQNPTEMVSFLARRRTESITTVVVEAYEVVEGDETR